MTRRILLDSLCGQTRLAVIEDGELCEYYTEVEETGSLSGNIYNGRVQSVLPGMNAAFVDIGLEKNAFLYAGDIQVDTRSDSDLSDKLKRQQISKLVRNGQNVLVQVVKEPGGSKGPRVSCHVTMAGRLLVLMPTIKYIGVSRKIADADERTRLHDIGAELCDKNGCGVIMRTAAANADVETLTAEYTSLCEEWEQIKRRGEHMSKVGLVNSRGGLVNRAIRDMLSDETVEIVTDNNRLHAKLSAEAELTAPAQAKKIALSKCDIPLFDVYRIEKELESAFSHNVWLKSGGYIVIDYTEALTVVDVNTGKFVGNKSLEETIFTTNCEAAKEIARQLRLRDIGGMIIIDFIDMDKKEERDQLLSALKTELSRDRRRTNLSGLTSLGLVEMTRKKTHQSLQRQLMRQCPLCRGSGYIKEAEAHARDALYELRRRAAGSPSQAYVISAPRAVYAALKRIGVPSGVKAWLYETASVEAYEIKTYDKSELPAEAVEAPCYQSENIS